MKKFILLWVLCVPFCSYSQFSDNFSDGRFTRVQPSTHPEWKGDANKFIVNEALQLQLNAPKDGSPAQLRTQSQAASNTLWECRMQMNFNPTSSNYAKIYLGSSQEDLTGELNGLFLRVGYTNKNLSLVSQTGKTTKILIEGTTKRLDLTSVSIRIKATLDKNGKFSLYSQLEGETESVLEGSCSITSVPASQWFGVVCTYTSTRNSHFYFDDFVVRELRDDEQGGTPSDPISDPKPGEIIINELLFNPPTGGNEYVELYNRSEKSIDLRFLSITSRKSSDGSLNKAYPLTANPLLLHPQEYVIVTKNKDLVCAHFQCRPESFYTELSVMPSITNTSGCVVLINNQTEAIVDEFTYNEKMHAEGISNKKGVALERLNPDNPTNDPINWHSAAAETGYGTPGYTNSQHTNPLGIEEELHVINPDITVDSYRIQYKFNAPGYRCRAFVYDSMGRMIQTIANNELLGSEGTLYWNGKGNNNQTLTSGIYIIYMEVFDMKGCVKKYKRPAVVK